MARRVLTVAACALVLALPPLDAAASGRAKAVTKIVRGSTVVCKKWGQLQLRLKVSRSIVRGKVKVKILDVSWPIWPQHTVKSVFINERALPLLEQQALQVQSAKFETISGATDISVSFKRSLQAALLSAAKTTKK